MAEAGGGGADFEQASFQGGCGCHRHYQAAEKPACWAGAGRFLVWVGSCGNDGAAGRPPVTGRKRPGGGLWASRRCAEQPRQADQVVGCHRQGELPVDFGQAAVPGLAQPGDGLGPAERLLDPLADALADGVAGMARGAAVDCRASPTGVLRQVWGNVDLAEFGNEVAGVEALVCAEGDRVRAVGVRRDQVQRGQPLSMARGTSGGGTDDQAVPVLHERMAHEAELGLLAGAFAEQLGIRIGYGGMRVVAALLTAEVLLAVALGVGWRARAVLVPEAFDAGPGLQQRAVHREVLGREQDADPGLPARWRGSGPPPRPPAAGRGSW